MSDTFEIAQAVRNACVRAALDGYEQAQIAGLCREGAWECAVDAMRMLDLRTMLQAPMESTENQPPPRGPVSA